MREGMLDDRSVGRISAELTTRAYPAFQPAAAAAVYTQPPSHHVTLPSPSPFHPIHFITRISLTDNSTIARAQQI